MSSEKSPSSSPAEAPKESSASSSGKPPKKFDRSIVEGPIRQAVWKIAWPTMLMNVISGLQGLVDHIMVGRYVGFEANAAIGVSWQIFLVIVVFVSSLYAGMGVLVARFAGANQPEKVSRVVHQVLLASAFLGFGVFAPVGYFGSPALLDLVNAEPAVQAEALPYLRILFVFGVGMMYFFLFSGALRAAGDAKTPMHLGILLTGLNLLLNVIFIPIFGTIGAAIGTVSAGIAVTLLAFLLLVRGKLVISLPEKPSFKPDASVLREVLRFGLPTGFQGIAMNLGGVLLIRFVGSLEQSAQAQAAFAVCYTQLFSLVTWTSNGLMAAAITVTGQNLGAEQPERASRAPLVCTLVGLLLAGPLAAAYLFLPQTLLGVFGLEDPIVLSLGEQLLAFLSLSCLFVAAALSYTGALQGSGDTKSPMWISIISQLVLPLGLCAIFAATIGLEAWHIWTAIVVGHFLRATLSIGRFRQEPWKNIRVELDEDAS